MGGATPQPTASQKTPDATAASAPHMASNQNPPEAISGNPPPLPESGGESDEDGAARIVSLATRSPTNRPEGTLPTPETRSRSKMLPDSPQRRGGSSSFSYRSTTSTPDLIIDAELGAVPTPDELALVNEVRTLWRFAKVVLGRSGQEDVHKSLEEACIRGLAQQCFEAAMKSVSDARKALVAAVQPRARTLFWRYVRVCLVFALIGLVFESLTRNHRDIIDYLPTGFAWLNDIAPSFSGAGAVFVGASVGAALLFAPASTRCHTLEAYHAFEAAYKRRWLTVCAACCAAGILGTLGNAELVTIAIGKLAINKTNAGFMHAAVFGFFVGASGGAAPRLLRQKVSAVFPEKRSSDAAASGRVS